MDARKNESEALELGGIEKILASDEEIVPSSGFLAAVMEKVQDEARTPVQIAFPWKRAVPGFVLIAGVFGWGGVELVSRGISATKGVSLSEVHEPIAMGLPLQQLQWVALAVGVSLVSWLLARRLAGRPGTL